MANRNVSQLPENATPQGTDWILGASGNSPSVLQKIAVGNLFQPIPTKTSQLQNDSGFLVLDTTGIKAGQSIKWDSTLQKFVFFSLVLGLKLLIIYPVPLSSILSL